MKTTVLLAFYLCVNSAAGQIFAPDVSTCPAEISNDAAVHWPSSNETLGRDRPVESSPLCLSDLKFVLHRNCTKTGWVPPEPPVCSYTQPKFEETNHCPLGYESIPWKGKRLCLLLTQPQSWNNTCLSSGSTKTIFDLNSDDRSAIFNYLADKRVESVWMPAKRFQSYGPVRWTLPGSVYGDTVEFDDIEVEIAVERYADSCFSLNISNFGQSGSVENCGNQHPVLCVYPYDTNPLLQLACPDGFYTTRYESEQDRCYSTHKIQGIGRMRRRLAEVAAPFNWVSSECRGDLYSLNSAEKTVIFERLTKRSGLSSGDRCLFGVLPNVYIENQMQWSALVPFVEYVNWAYPLDTVGGNIIAADRDGKWHWTRDTFTCIACQRQLNLQRPQIHLKFHDEHLYVIVYNKEFLWREHSDEPGIKCFTDSDNELIRDVRVEDEVWSGLLTMDDITTVGETSRSVYELRTYGDGPGYYWCDGHAVPNFELIQSEPIVAYKNVDGEVFAVLIETHCNQCHHYFKSKFVKEMARKFKDYLNNLRKKFRRQMLDEINIENVRVMKIEWINVPQNVSQIIFHVTVSLEHDIDDSEEDHLQMSDDMIQVYKLRNYLQQMLSSTKSPEYKYVSLNSTEYCLPDSISVITDLSWVNAKIGETSAPKELCLAGNGLPVRRQCVGDFIYGGQWTNRSGSMAPCSNQALSPITQTLYDIDRMFTNALDTSGVIENLTALMATTNTSSVIPADLFYLGKVMQTITKFSNNLTSDEPLLRRNESENIFTIYNSLMSVNENTTKLSAALNSTNILLDAFDNIVNHLTSENLLLRSGINLTENVQDGTIAVITPKILVYVIDPLVSNVSGIALFRRPEWYGFVDGNETARNLSMVDDDFTNYDIRLLYTNHSKQQLLEEEFLEIASFVPQNLLDRLNETRKMVGVNGTISTTPNVTVDIAPPVRIVITIYYNDLLFQEYRETTYAKASGKIISVSIPGYGPILPVLLPIFIKTNNFTNASDVCGYWNYQSDQWSRDGCEYGGNSGYFDPIVLCACSHLTHFAYLVMGTYFHTISGDDDVIITDIHQDALDLITLLGCSLSLIGIGGIVVTALIFPTWREKAGSKVLLHLSAAIALQMILICFVNTEVRSLSFFLNQQWYSCVSMGALLHYSVLVAFTWMLITAYLQFIRYVRVIGHVRSSRFFLKSFLFGWGAPLVPVFLVVCIDPNSYIPDLERLGQGICYPMGYGLYFGVILPMGLIVLANLVIFLLVIYNVIRGPDGKLRSTERDLTLAQLRLTVLLFFLLGLTWIFGFCASTQAGLVFSYLFCLTATMQGFVLFLYFIILDPITRNLWSRFLKKYLGCSAGGSGGADGFK